MVHQLVDHKVRSIRWGYRVLVLATGMAVLCAPAVANAAPPSHVSPSGLSGSANSGQSHHGKVHKSSKDRDDDGDRWGDKEADNSAKDRKGKNSPDADSGSLYTVDNAIGAHSVWKESDANGQPITGRGVVVALLDSGVAAVPGLDAPGKVVHGPDLSIEANGTLIDQDTYGHGTHLAGIIAARDPGPLTKSSIAKLSPSTQLGVAPDATIESIKLATTDGSTDVSQVIAALNWITEHQTLPDGSRVRVVNLAFGTDSVQPYQADPLAAAAENAWRNGLVVVVSGGNNGPNAVGLTDPAIDPYVLSVGASDAGRKVNGWSKPTVATFSSSGTAQRHVDVLAPGQSIASMRNPGSFIDANFPQGRVSGDDTGRLFRGSGTSQAAAVVSGAVALLLQAYPDLTPDQVKAALVATAKSVKADVTLAGAGQIDVAAAHRALKDANNPKSKFYVAKVAQSWPVSTGQGSLDAARGGNYLVDADGAVISGEIDIQGAPWDAANWWIAASSLNSWDDGEWNGSVWTGDAWTGDLSSARWSSARWSSARWSSARWSAARWSSARWSSARWSATGWDSARWSSAPWH